MSAAWTKGPWSVIDNSWDVSTVYDAADNVVAECPIDGDVCEESQAQYEPIKEANARLIAAAPELYEAVEALLASHREGVGQCCSAADKGIAALAKARGEAAKLSSDDEVGRG